MMLEVFVLDMLILMDQLFLKMPISRVNGIAFVMMVLLLIPLVIMLHLVLFTNKILLSVI